MKLKFNHVVNALSAVAIGSVAYVSLDNSVTVKNSFTTACVGGGYDFGEKRGDVMFVVIYPKGQESLSGLRGELSGLDYDVLAVAPRSIFGQSSNKKQQQDLYAYTHYGQGEVMEGAGPLAILRVSEPDGTCTLHFAYRPPEGGEMVSSKLSAPIYGDLER